MTSLVPHVTTQDIIYEGYLIPKGTCLLGNIWFVAYREWRRFDISSLWNACYRFILSNAKTYPSPDVFDPERFLGENQQLDPREVCFGWGRRGCPGVLLAESTIFIWVAMALATLDISRCVEKGVEWVPRYEVEEGMVR